MRQSTGTGKRTRAPTPLRKDAAGRQAQFCFCGKALTFTELSAEESKTCNAAGVWVASQADLDRFIEGEYADMKHEVKTVTKDGNLGMSYIYSNCGRNKA